MISKMLGAPLGGTTVGGQYGFESLASILIVPPNGAGGGGRYIAVYCRRGVRRAGRRTGRAGGLLGPRGNAGNHKKRRCGECQCGGVHGGSSSRYASRPTQPNASSTNIVPFTSTPIGPDFRKLRECPGRINRDWAGQAAGPAMSAMPFGRLVGGQQRRRNCFPRCATVRPRNCTIQKLRTRSQKPNMPTFTASSPFSSAGFARPKASRMGLQVLRFKGAGCYSVWAGRTPATAFLAGSRAFGWIATGRRFGRHCPPALRIGKSARGRGRVGGRQGRPGPDVVCPW